LDKVFFGFEEDILDPCFDGTFKALFCKDTAESKGALRNLLFGYIGRSLDVINITANEPPIEDVRDRQIRYDISCRFEDGELTNIEMTMHPDRLEPYRVEYFASKLLTSQEIRGIDKSWGDLKNVYQISFLANGRLFGDDALTHHFRYYDEEARMPLGGRASIITVEMAKLGGALQKGIADMTLKEKWALFLKYGPDKGKRPLVNEILKCEEGIAMAAQTLLSISRDEVERARLLSEYKFAVDYQSGLVNAKREGHAEGRAEGHTEGRTEGRAEGRAEERYAVARSMLAGNMDIGLISRFTGLTADEIAELYSRTERFSEL
jgi:predicted transposase/invertase (TIGR01784 family)